MKLAPAALMMALVAAGPFPAISSAASPHAACTCRTKDGSRRELGQTVCIRIGDAAYLARCEMDLNVTTWKKLKDGCPEARLSLSPAST
jgi:hypothetical protein